MIKKCCITHKIIIYIILFTSIENLHSQCNIQNAINDDSDLVELDYTYEPHSYGQSFVADCNGTIDYFEISKTFEHSMEYSTVQSIEIFNGTDINGTPIHSQQYNEEDAFTTVIEVGFAIDGDVQLSSGSTYTIIINSLNVYNARVFLSNNDSYGSGSAIVDGVVQPDNDLFFSVHISDPSSNCNVGNEYLIGNITSVHTQNNFLFLRPVTLSNPGYLTGLGFTGINTNSQIRMAFYDDLNNAPNNLLAETPIETFNYGKQTLPVAPVALTPGNYWISYAVDGTYNQPFWNDLHLQPYEDIYYMNLSSFEEPLPDPFVGGNIQPNDTQVPIFAEISCSALGLDEYSFLETKIYPNPSSEKIYAKGIVDEIEYVIYSLVGEKVDSGTITEGSFINVSNLTSGLYIIRFKNEFNFKFLKI